MRVRDAMTPNPAACDRKTSLRLVAQLMTDHGCAAIPVTESGKLIGIITDRDIALRGVAPRLDASGLSADACMTRPVIAVEADEPIEKAIELMEENAIHHLPVILADGTLVGILAQSDLGRRMTNREFGALARFTSIAGGRVSRLSSALVKRDH
ncbi:MAG TPA: CBS domain-containing protein [Thermoanaerobaculia bacterium]